MVSFCRVLPFPALKSWDKNGSDYIYDIIFFDDFDRKTAQRYEIFPNFVRL